MIAVVGHYRFPLQCLRCSLLMRFHLARAFFRFFSAAFRCFGVSLRAIVFFCSYTVIFFIQQQADRVQNGSAESIVGCHKQKRDLQTYFF